MFYRQFDTWQARLAYILEPNVFEVDLKTFGHVHKMIPEIYAVYYFSYELYMLISKMEALFKFSQ